MSMSVELTPGDDTAIGHAAEFNGASVNGFHEENDEELSAALVERLETAGLLKSIEEFQSDKHLDKADILDFLRELELEDLDFSGVVTYVTRQGYEVVGLDAEIEDEGADDDKAKRSSYTRKYKLDVYDLFLEDASKHPFLTAAEEVYLAKKKDVFIELKEEWKLKNTQRKKPISFQEFQKDYLKLKDKNWQMVKQHLKN